MLILAQANTMRNAGLHMLLRSSALQVPLHLSGYCIIPGVTSPNLLIHIGAPPPRVGSTNMDLHTFWGAYLQYQEKK